MLHERPNEAFQITSGFWRTMYNMRQQTREIFLTRSNTVAVKYLRSKERCLVTSLDHSVLWWRLCLNSKTLNLKDPGHPEFPCNRASRMSVNKDTKGRPSRCKLKWDDFHQSSILSKVIIFSINTLLGADTAVGSSQPWNTHTGAHTHTHT